MEGASRFREFRPLHPSKLGDQFVLAETKSLVSSISAEIRHLLKSFSWSLNLSRVCKAKGNPRCCTRARDSVDHTSQIVVFWLNLPIFGCEGHLVLAGKRILAFSYPKGGSFRSLHARRKSIFNLRFLDVPLEFLNWYEYVCERRSSSGFFYSYSDTFWLIR